MGVLPKEFKRECLLYLKQAYYIASAMQQPFIGQFLKDHIKLHYMVEVYI
jgi:hypothetical protein